MSLRLAWLTLRRLQDPDTKLLQQVAGSVRDSTEKNVRERCASSFESVLRALPLLC